MPNYAKEQWNAKKEVLMEKCYDCFAEYGLHGTGIRALTKHCGCISNMLYTYFENLDDLIFQSTEYCMSRVEAEFMTKTPTDAEGLWRFIDEIPYWTAKEHGQKFVKGVDERYTEYARSLEARIGIHCEKLTPLIFILIRACVHYALSEDDFYLKAQIEVIKETLTLFIDKYSNLKMKKEEK